MRFRPIVVICVLASALPASAEPVRVLFEGYLTSAHSVQNPAIERFDRFAGFFEFDTETPALWNLPGRAVYSFPPTNSLWAFEIAVGGLTSEPEAPIEGLIAVGNDVDWNFPDDPTSLERLDLFRYSITGQQTRATITLSDATLHALSDTDLPRFFDVNIWDDARVTAVAPYQTIRHPDGTLEFPGSTLLISGTIDTLRVIPDPSTLSIAIVAIMSATAIGVPRCLFRNGRVSQR